MVEEKEESNRKQMWVSENFKKMIEQLKGFERKRGNIHCSNTDATEILYRRIQNKGGLKEEI